MRRALLIIAILIVLVGIGAVAYLFLFANKSGVMVAPSGSVSLPSSGQGIDTTSSSTQSTSSAGPTAVSSRLTEITSGPVVPGVLALDVPAADASSSPDTHVLYIERGSGNAYSYSEHAAQVTRTSNKTVPGLEQAFWLPNGSAAFVQYLSGTDFSTVNTYALAADGSGGFFLPQDLAGIAVSSTSVLALASGVNGSSASLYTTDGSKSHEAFTTPLSALAVAFAGKGQYLAYTKPAASLAGYAYLVDGNGVFAAVAGPLNGLVALPSPDGKWALVSYASAAGAMQTELVNIATHEAIPLPVATIADKCSWAADDSAVYCGIPQSPSAAYAYPDDWYQGAVSFSDRIWKIDVAGRFAQLVLDFNKETGKTLDAESLATDPAGRILTFVNKSDGSLWSYQL
jgi:hypothetical protein